MEGNIKHLKQISIRCYEVNSYILENGLYLLTFKSKANNHTWMLYDTSPDFLNGIFHNIRCCNYYSELILQLFADHAVYEENSTSIKIFEFRKYPTIFEED